MKSCGFFTGGDGILSWPKFPGASSYNVHRATDPFADFTLVGSTSQQSWLVWMESATSSF